jgi:hypothetical protein
VGKPKLKYFESAEKDLQKTGLRNWRRSSRTESSGGQFWKWLKFTKGKFPEEEEREGEEEAK